MTTIRTVEHDEVRPTDLHEAVQRRNAALEAELDRRAEHRLASTRQTSQFMLDAASGRLDG